MKYMRYFIADESMNVFHVSRHVAAAQPEKEQRKKITHLFMK